MPFGPYQKPSLAKRSQNEKKTKAHWFASGDQMSAELKQCFLVGQKGWGRKVPSGGGLKRRSKDGLCSETTFRISTHRDTTLLYLNGFGGGSAVGGIGLGGFGGLNPTPHG